MRVLDADGAQIGVMPTEEAIRRAEEAGLDLIEVAASADPPVCRIADLGKFKFEQDKRARDAKKNQHVSEVKEVRLRPRTRPVPRGPLPVRSLQRCAWRPGRRGKKAEEIP